MGFSVSSFLLILYVTCETIRANYAYYAFHTFPRISASLINLLSEAAKLIIALFCLLRSNDGFSVSGLAKCIKRIQQGDTLEFKRVVKYALPAGLYLANNLIYYTVLPKTSPSLLQVCVLAKLPTTGILHHYMIKPQRNLCAWVSLLCLCIGLVVFNIPSGQHSKAAAEAVASWYLAPVAGLVIACLSALASITTETSTKMGEFWESQAYLYIWGIVFSMVAIPLVPPGGNRKAEDEVSLPFDVWSAVFGLVIVTAGTGLVVAMVLRARDNILKLVGTAASLVTIAASQFILLPQLQASTFTSWKICGGGIVTISTWCYNHYSQISPTWSTIAVSELEIESEGLIDPDDLEIDEKSISEDTKTKVEEEFEENQILKPTPGKVVCCMLFVLFITMEVSLRTY